MTQLEQLYALYGAYEEKAKQVRSRASRFAGAFGLGDDPRKHGCHEQFFEDVGRWSRGFLACEPEPQTLLQAVWWILEAADRHRNTDMFGYLYAAQAHTRELIPRLPRAESGELLIWYEKTYPEGERLPVQQQVCRLLRQQAGLSSWSQGGLRGFFQRRRRT